MSLIRLGEAGQPSQTSEDDGGRRPYALLSSIISARQSAKLLGLKARLPTLLAQEGARGYRIALPLGQYRHAGIRAARSSQPVLPFLTA